MNKVKLLSIGLVIMLLSACGGGQRVEVIDLNKVLDVMVTTLKEMDAKSNGAKVDPKDTAAKAKYMEDFNKLFATKLNAAKVYSQPIGTQVEKEGSIMGFLDKNKNMKYELGNGDRRLFRVEVDAAKKRLIAADLQRGYYRDQGYHFSGTGLLAGMLIGHMLSRQSASGFTGSRYSNQRMSPKNYHSGAVSRARAQSRARSRSRSGSFSRGK